RMRDGGRPAVRDRAVRADVRHRGHARRHPRLPGAPQAPLRQPLIPPTISMHRKPDATGAAMPLPLRLLHCLLADDPDRAIELGLMDYAPSPGDDALDPAHPDLPQRLLQAQARLRTAWA